MKIGINEMMRKLLWPKKLPPRGKNVGLCRFADVAFVTWLLNKIEDSIYTCGWTWLDAATVFGGPYLEDT